MLKVPSSFANFPCTDKNGSPRTAIRYRSLTSGRTITLIIPCSSSKRTKTVPFAVDGRCRATTRPATSTSTSCSRSLTRDAKRHDVDVFLPDINRSDVHCTVEGQSLRVGLAFVRDCGLDVTEEMVIEREQNGPFASLGDLVRRAPPKLSREAIENLVWVGACNAFGLTRRELLWQVGLWLPPKTEVPHKHRARRQLELPLNHPYENLRFGGMVVQEEMLAEYQMLGFAASGHPFSIMQSALPPDRVTYNELRDLEHDVDVEVAGLVVARQRPSTAKGTVFVLLEDEQGMINVIVRPDVNERYRMAVRGEPFLSVHGKLAKDDGTFNIIADALRPLKVSMVPAPTFSETPAYSPYKFLRSLRQHPPAAKSWG